MSAGSLTKKVLLFLLGLAVIWLFAVSIPLTIASPPQEGDVSVPARALSAAGWLAVIVGACVIVWCYLLFAFVGGGTPWPFDPPRTLVVSGPYRFVRNPMEVAFLLILLGESAILKSKALIVYYALAFLLLHLRQVLFDEPALKRRFGEAYERYSQAVPRWIPRLTPYQQG